MAIKYVNGEHVQLTAAENAALAARRAAWPENKAKHDAILKAKRDEAASKPKRDK